MGVKYFEYSHKFHEGLLPGKYYSHQGDTVPGQFMFFSFYFMMTGLHGIHVLLGVVAILWITFRAWRNQFSAKYYGPVDIVGLYWHWSISIGSTCFPLMYLFVRSPDQHVQPRLPRTSTKSPAQNLPRRSSALCWC